MNKETVTITLGTITEDMYFVFIDAMLKKLRDDKGCYLEIPFNISTRLEQELAFVCLSVKRLADGTSLLSRSEHIDSAYSTYQTNNKNRDYYREQLSGIIHETGEEDWDESEEEEEEDD